MRNNDIICLWSKFVNCIGGYMDKNIKMKRQIEEVRETLNNKLLQDILNKETINMDTLNLSWKLDKLIADYMKKKILDK